MDQQIFGLGLVVGEQRLQIANLSTELQITRSQLDAANARVAELEGPASPPDTDTPSA